MKVNEAIWNPLETGSPVVVHEGGTSCFEGGTLISTLGGCSKIKDLKPGDLIKSHDTKRGIDVHSVVTGVHRFKNTKPTIRVILKDGREIIATEDHKFYYEGGWFSLKHILSLKERKIEEG